MPMKPVTLRRWEIGVAFTAITVAFVVQGLLLKSLSDRNHHLIVAQHNLSASRVKDRKQVDVKICAKLDRVTSVLIAIVSAPSVPTKPGQPGYAYYQSHPRERATLMQGKAQSTRLTVDKLRAAACDPRNLTKGQGP